MQSNTQLNPISSKARLVTHPAASQMTARRIELRQDLRIALPMQQGFRFINTNDIMHCEAESNYCNITLEDGERILISKTLKWVVSHLPAARFVRVHASHLVRIDKISFWHGDYIELDCKVKVPVSRSRRAEVQECLGIN